MSALNQAVITQVLDDLRNGQLRRCLDMGFSPDDLQLLKQPELVSLLLNTPVPWCSIKVNVQVLHRLLHQSQDAGKEITLIDRMLLLDASSKMICEVFGLTQREVAFRRSILGLKKRQGRWTELADDVEHELWRYWHILVRKYGFNVRNEREMAKTCMWLAEEKTLTMAQVWQAIEKWVRDGLY